jgi:3-oxoacyl-(acyl-carrier-protein) synthase/NAD(P)-dependent dehydrogenase (short-subunit alcohol dehydrogenase family)/acyl carrier protein
MIGAGRRRPAEEGAVPHFLDQIEHLSKPRLLELVVALREEILQLRPDEFVGASSIEGLAYETHWHAAPLAADRAVGGGPSVRLLLITDHAEAMPSVDADAQAQLVRLTIDPAQGWAPQAFADRLHEHAGHFDAVAYYPSAEAVDLKQPQALLDRWCTALALAAAVTGLATQPRLWLITRHAQFLPGDAVPINLALAPLAGLGKSLSLEHPATWGGCIDIDDAPDAFDRALVEIASGVEDEVAYRAGVRYVPVLERFAGGVPAPAALRPDASYLVTGGTGGIGSVLISHLLARGVARIVVFNRCGASSPAVAQLLARWRAAHPRASVELIETDLAAALAVERGIAALRRQGPPLRGIFHVAGSSEQVALAHLDRALIERVVCAKALGALYLDHFTREDTLDFQVYFSSIAGSWGTASMVPYAMANRFLDALSTYRNQHGRVTRSIAWGPWASVGMIVKQNQGAFTALGLGLIEPAQGLRMLDRLIGVDRAQLQVVDVDWRRYAQSIALDKHLRGFGRQIDAAPRLAEGIAPGTVTDDFSTSQQTLALLAELVVGLLGERLPEGGELRPMQELGLTSLLSVELSQKIRHRLGVACRPTVVFDHPTLSALAQDLAARWLQAHPRPADGQGGAAAHATSATSAVDDSEAIAIVGMACTLPGADSPARLWDRLKQAIHTGEDAIEQAPAHRFELARYGSTDNAPGKAYSLAGGYLDDIAGFDHALFQLSRREAQFMDPQQRLALETTWRAFENAGIEPSTLLSGDAAGASDAAVFFGIGLNEYGPLCRSVLDSEHTGLMATGQSMGVIAGRVAHVFGLHGPAIAYDTACSSSLVALDAAVRHLRRGQGSLAVVGGVNALISPDSFVLLAKAGALSRQGRCAAFDVRADGYVRAEGCVVVVLKRLSDARADGDTVQAIIRGSAINHDGRSSGLTAPNGRAQERVMRAALRDAGVSAEQVALVEAHGTGTPLGDPIEYHALRAVYADELQRAAPLQLGTIKAFIGHTEATSGLAGLLKLVLSLRNRAMPAQLHYSTLNPYIDASKSIEIPTATRPLSAAGTLLGAVSSFGFNGTNAHVIIERGDDQPSRQISARPFKHVHCWYSERSLPASSGLAQAFAPQPNAAPSCYVKRWQAPPAESDEPARNVLLLRQAGAGQRYRALRDALLARGVRCVEIGCDELAGLQGAFDRAVLCLAAASPLADAAIDGAWLDDLAAGWSALAALVTAPVAIAHLLVIGGPTGFDGEVDPHWAAVLSCCAKERPGFSATLVECATDTDAAQLPAQLDWLLATREPVYVLSGQGAVVPRLGRLAPVANGELRLAADRSYLVSGGLGGLGAELIGWLLERGARHIVNLNRRSPSAEQAAVLEQLARKHDARIDALTVDLADLPGVQRVLNIALSAAPPLAGVFHCAGALDDGVFGRQPWSQVAEVLRSKFVSGWNLHLATLRQPLEHFVVFSSLAVLLGQAGQAGYALANALAERLIAHRRAQGRPGLAVQWGPWSDAGMVSRAGNELASRYHELGLSLFGARDYLPVLSTLLSGAARGADLPAQVAVFGLDWERYLANAPRSPLCAELAPAVRMTLSPATRSLARRLAGLAPERRARQLRDQLKQMVADCLDRSDVASIADSDGFAELGIDSLHSMILHKKLEGELGEALSSTTAFDHPTVAALADFLSGGPLKALFPSVETPAEVDDAMLRSHSEEELARILTQEIEYLGQRGAVS